MLPRLSILALLVFFSLAGTVSARVGLNSEFLLVDKDYLSIQRELERLISSYKLEVNQSHEKSFDIFFDKPEFDILSFNSYLRYHAVEYLSKKKNKTKYQESIEYSSVNEGLLIVPVRHYQTVRSFEEKHPLLSLVKRSERAAFIDALKRDGIRYPMRLKEVVQVSRNLQAYTIAHGDMNVASVNVIQYHSTALRNAINFQVVQFSLDGQAINKMPMVDRVRFNDFLVAVKSSLNDSSSHLGGSRAAFFENEYALVFSQLEENISFLSLRLRFPFLINLFNAMVVGFVGLLCIMFLFHKRIEKYE